MVSTESFVRIVSCAVVATSCFMRNAFHVVVLARCVYAVIGLTQCVVRNASCAVLPA